MSLILWDKVKMPLSKKEKKLQIKFNNKNWKPYLTSHSGYAATFANISSSKKHNKLAILYADWAEKV